MCAWCSGRSSPPRRIRVTLLGRGYQKAQAMLGLDVDDSEDEMFWTQFLRSLKNRGLDGVHLAISDAHTGLKEGNRTGFRRRLMAAMQGAGDSWLVPNPRPVDPSEEPSTREPFVSHAEVVLRPGWSHRVISGRCIRRNGRGSGEDGGLRKTSGW